MMAAPPASDSEVPKKSALWMFANIWFEPGRVFEQVARAPRWWIPLLILSIATVAYLAAFSTQVGWDTFIRREMDNNPRLENLSSEQRAQIISTQAKFASIAGYVGAPVGIVGNACIIAAVLILIFKYLLDAPCGFGQALGVVSWSMLPGLLKVGAAILMVYLQSPQDFDLKNPVGVNIGYYLSSGSPAWVRSLLSSLDLFALWNLLLVATGMSVVARKPWGSALVAILIPWGLYVVITTGGAALFG
ncbi:MAG: YIP1 family protein [Acidobacteria bacterium]|nr:YIP1 family protein [Acidobacteriota bacterium]